MPIPERYKHLRAFAFGDSPELADKLLELVVKGIKTATCSTEASRTPLRPVSAGLYSTDVGSRDVSSNPPK